MAQKSSPKKTPSKSFYDRFLKYEIEREIQNCDQSSGHRRLYQIDSILGAGT